MKKIVILAFLTIITSFQANANIKRSCNGTYWITRLDEIDKARSVSHGFKATGSCGNLVPIRCYRRARAKIMKCLTKHWQTKTKNYRPYECTSTARVYGYEVINLRDEVIKEACRLLGHQIATFSIRADSYSHKKECRVKKVLQNSFTVDCQNKTMWIND